MEVEAAEAVVEAAEAAAAEAVVEAAEAAAAEKESLPAVRALSPFASLG
jgi:hypothetical protein